MAKKSFLENLNEFQSSVDPITGLSQEPINPSLKPKFSESILPSPHIEDVGEYFDIFNTKYDKYITSEDLSDIENERGLMQPVGEKWSHGLTKFAGKTGTALLGATIGSIAGIANAIKDRSFDSIFDNGFQNMLDEWNEKMDQALPNYTTKLEREEGFLQSLNNANFWANDFLGGLSFTTGAVLSEMVWSGLTAATFGAAAGVQGAATAGLLARAARYIKQSSKGIDVVRQLSKINTLNRAEQGARIARQLYTGAGYEAGVEARQHKKELTDMLQAEWRAANPDATSIPNDVLASIDETATKSSNGVFAANMGIVGLSNMIALPRIFGPGLNSQIRKASAIALEGTEGTMLKTAVPAYKNASRFEKIVSGAYISAKNPFVEGIWEEGMQGVANNTMLDYTTKKYNPDGTEEVGYLLESFGEGLAETYGSKQGWKEIGIGMLIGMIGSPNINAFKKNQETKRLERVEDQPLWTGGIAGEFQERQRARTEADRLAKNRNDITQEKLINFFQNNPEALKSTTSLIGHNIRTSQLNAEMDAAVENNDMFAAKNIEHDILHSFITSRIDAGFESDIKDEFSDLINNMNDQDFSTTFDYENLSDKDLAQRKKQTLDNFNKKVDKISKITRMVDGSLKIDLGNKNNRDIRESLIYAGSVIDNVDQREEEISNQLYDLTGVSYDPRESIDEYKKKVNEVKELKGFFGSQIVNKPESDKLLKDIESLRKRRENYIKQYNHLFTKKGQEEYTTLQKELIKEFNNIIQENRKKEYDSADVVVNKETGKRYTKIKKDGKQVLIEVDENDKPVSDTEQEVEIDDNFIQEFELGKSLSKKVLSKDAQERLKKKINEFKDPDNLADFINKEIKPLNLSNIDDVIKEAGKVWKQLTGSTLKFNANILSTEKVYKEKESGKRFIVKRDDSKKDTFSVTELGVKKGTEETVILSKEQLDENFVFEKSWQLYKNKQGRTGNLEKMITVKESLLDEVKADEKILTERLDNLKEELRDHITKLRKQEKDNRSTLKSIERTEDLINLTQNLILEIQNKVDKSIKNQAELKDFLQYLNARLIEESEQDSITDLKAKVKNIEDDIKVNEEAILSWKYVVDTLKKLINQLLKFVKLSKHYQFVGKDVVLKEYADQLQAETYAFANTIPRDIETNVEGVTQKVANFEWYRKQKEALNTLKKKLIAKKAAVQRAIDKGISAENEVNNNEIQLITAENQIRAFEKANEDLKQKLFYIKQEVDSLREYRRQQEFYIKGYTPISKKIQNKSLKETASEGEVTVTKDEITIDPVSPTEEKKIWSGIKRSLENVFVGLAGKHVNDDNETLNSKEDQRRYYRWTSKTNLRKGEYHIKIVKPPKSHKKEIEEGGKYKFKDAYYAVVVKKTGDGFKYITEDGSLSDKFNTKIHLYTSFPLDNLETEDYGDKYFTPQTKEEWAALGYNKSEEENLKNFNNRKEYLLKYHTTLRENIKEQLKNNQEVIFKLVGKGYGIPNDPHSKINEPVNIALEEAFGHKDVEVMVATKSTLNVHGHIFTGLPQGLTFIHDNQTGNLYTARKRKLNEREIDMVINIIKSHVNRCKIEGKKIITKGSNELYGKDGSVIEKNLWNVLKDLAFYTDNNIDKETKEVINKNDRTKFHIIYDKYTDENTGIPLRGLNIGGKEYQFYMIHEGKVIINKQLIDDEGNGDLREFLRNQYVNINSAKLKSNADFIEYVSVDENGVVDEFKIHEGKDGGYKKYLIGEDDGNHIIGVSTVKAGETMNIGLDEQGNPVREEAPRAFNQYAIYEPTFDYVSRSAEEVKEDEPVIEPQSDFLSETFDKLPETKPGDRIMVKIVGINNVIEQSGILEKDENDTFVSVEGNLSSNVLIGVNAIKNSPEGVIDYNVALENTKKKIIVGFVQAPVKKSETTVTLENNDIIEVENKKAGTVKKVEIEQTEESDIDAIYRMPANDQRGVEDLKKAEKWFKERFPDVDFKVVLKLIDGKAHGQFKEAAVYIYENAEVGTTYHEAFHVVTQLFLTETERKALYDEFKQRFPDKANFTDKQIEEAIAEDFRDYILSKENPDRKFDFQKYETPVKLNFFQRLYNFIKNFIFGKPDTIAEVFQKIENNQYRNKIPVVKSTDVTFNRAFISRDEAFTKAVLEGVNYFFFRKLFSEETDIITLYNKDDNREIVKKLYDEALNSIIKVRNNFSNRLKVITSEEEKEDITQKINALEFVIRNWNFAEEGKDDKEKIEYSVRGLHRNFLTQYKLELVTPEEIIQENDITNDPDNQWANQSIKISSKMNAARNIKLLLGTLIDVEEVNGKFVTKKNFLGLPQNADFGRTFNILANKLAGVRDIKEMEDRINELADSKDKKLLYLKYSLLERLKLNRDPASLTKGQMIQRIQFIQTFAKAKNNFILDLTGENGKFVLLDSNSTSVIEKIKQSWKKNSAFQQRGYIVKDDMITYDKDFFEKFGVIDSRQKALDFLHILGIDFTFEDLIPKDANIDGKAEHIRKKIVKSQQPYIFSNDQDANVTEDLRYLLSFEASTTVDFIENSHYNINGELVYDVSLNNYLTTIINDFDNYRSLDELFSENPHLNPETNRYTANSIFLRKGGILFDENGQRRNNTFRIEIHEGSEEEASERTKEFEDLGEPDQLRVHINRGMLGAYPLLRPADNSIERYLVFDKPLLSNPEIINEQYLDIMLNYLKDELLRAEDIEHGEGSKWKNINTKSREGILLSIIGRDKELILEINNLLDNPDVSATTIVDNEESKERIKSILRDYFNTRTNKMIDTIVKYGIVEKSKDEYKNNGLNLGETKVTTSKYVSEKLLKTIIRNYIINDTIVNIEQTKIIFGDPINYKSVEDEFKRHSGVVGTKKISVIDEGTNEWIKENLKRTDSENHMGIKNGKPIIRTAVFSDVKVKSDSYDLYVKRIGKEKADAYAKMTKTKEGKIVAKGFDEGDAEGYISIDEWREMLFRAGDWTFGTGSLEDLYQWEIQREQGIAEPIDPDTGRVIDPSKLPVANPIKPQYIGPMAEEGFVMGFYKTSLFPLLPSVTGPSTDYNEDGSPKYEGFKQLEALRQKMKNTGTGIVVFETANKVGTKLNESGEVQQIYNEEGDFAFEEKDWTTQDTYYKYWGIQVDMGDKVHKRVVSGTQMGKQVINGVFENGQPKNKELGDLAEQYFSLNAKRINIGMSQLIDSLGLKKDDEKQEETTVKTETKIFKEQGINISSYESGLGGKLTNFARIPVIFNKKNYRSAEAAYQAEKTSLPDLSDKNVLKLMTEIIAAKLTQHPELVTEIYNAGGIDFLNESTHNLIKNGVNVKTDRWTGKDGLFMQALREAYGLAQFDLTAINDEKQEEQKPTVKTDKEGDYYKVDNIETLINKFKKEAIDRELPDNIIDAIENLKLGNGIDTLVNREKVENILMAMADAMTTSQKRSGSAKVQVANSLGRITREIVNESTGQVWKSSDLKFYTVGKDNKTVQAECYLPYYFKGRITDKDGKITDSRLLELIGFRIPTQGLNSIESLKIKGFLPAEAGDCIILPSEIVVKAGSDYDIDKLNIYYPNIYYDRNGNPKYIDYKDEDQLKKDYDEYTESLRIRLIQRLIKEKIFGTDSKNVESQLHKELKDIFKRDNFTIEDVINHLEKRIIDFKMFSKTDNSLQNITADWEIRNYTEKQEALNKLNDDIRNNPLNEFEPISFSEFQKRAIENKMSQIQKEIILNPLNFEQLITPNSAEALSEEAKKIRELKGLSRKDVATMNNIVEREYLMEVARRFLGGKQAVGITAVHSTFDILSKIANISIKPEITVWRGKSKNNESGRERISTKINLLHNKDKDGNISLAWLKDATGKENIPEMLSQWINAAVDAAKDPFMFDLNAGPETLNTVLYLTMTGVPRQVLTRFTTQPIISEYLANRRKWESQMMEGNREEYPDSKGRIITRKKKKNRDQIIEITKNKYTVVTKTASDKDNFTVKELESNIIRGTKGDLVADNKNDIEYAAQQLQILDDFLRYMDTARKLGEAIHGTDYDTNTGGKNISELLYRLKNTQKIKDDDFFIEYNKIFESGFIQPYYDAVKQLKDIFKPFFVSINDPSVVKQFDKLFEYIFHEQNNLPKDKKIKIVDRFKQAFITYLFVTRPFKINKKIYMKDNTALTMESQKNRLFKGDNSIAHRLDEKRKKYPEMSFLQQLESVINKNPNSTHHIIIRSKKLDVIESNRLTNEWRELLKEDEEFAVDLFMSSLLQFGIENSPFTFTNLAPFEIYGEVMNSILKRESKFDEEEKDILYDTFFNRFFHNNYSDNDILPKDDSPGADFMPFSKKTELKSGINRNQVAELRAKGINVFNPIPKIFKNFGDRVTFNGIRDYRNKRFLLDYSPERIDDNEKRDDIVKPVSEDEFLQSRISLFDLAVRYGVQETGFFTSKIDSELLKSDLKRLGYYNVKVEKSTVGTYYLSDGKKISYERLQNQYAQLEGKVIESPDAAINEKIRKWLDKAGIAYQNVKNITDRNGNPISAIAKADMFHKIVQVVEGKADITTLPEEAAHFLVEMLGDENPILKGMMNAVTETKVYHDVISEYGELYNHDEKKLKKEAVGKLIAKAIISQEKVANMSSFRRFWESAWRWLKKKLGLITSKEIEDDLAPFIEAADIILGNQNIELSLKHDIKSTITEIENKIGKPKNGLKRLWRIGNIEYDEGTWFTDNLNDLQWYWDHKKGIELFYVDVTEDEYKKAKVNPGPGNTDNEFLFIEEKGNVISPFRIKKVFKEVNYYQLSNTEEDKQMAKKIEANFKENRILRDLENKGYVTADGKKVKNRVTDFVKKFYKETFKRNEPESEHVKLLALKGTILHKYLQLIGEKIFTGQEAKWKDIEAEVIKQLTDPKDAANEDFLKKSKNFFALNDVSQFGELVRGIKKIKEQVDTKQKMIDPKGEVKFFPELIIYDEYGDVGGTIDLAVLYSNGTVGIYDYKGIDFKETGEIPLYKEQAYDIQIGKYKEVLARSYGVKYFGETRIIPIDIKMHKDEHGFKRIAMGATDINDNERPYLEQIPVSGEETEDAGINASLERMFGLYKELQGRLSADYKNEKLRIRVERMRRAIKGLQLKSDVTFIFNEINSLYADFYARENLKPDESYYLNDEALLEFEEYVEVYKGFGLNAMDTVKNLTGITEEERKKTIGKLERVAHMLEKMQRLITEKRKDSYKIVGTSKAEGILGRLFKQLSKFNHPAFKKLSQIVREISNATRLDINNIVSDINAKTEALKEWSKGRGESLQDAYDRLINSKTGNLIGRFSTEFYKERDEARKNKNKGWFVKNTNIIVTDGKYYYTGEIKEKFEKIKKASFEQIDKSLSGDQNEKAREKEKNIWMYKYDISVNPDAMFNERNFFIKFRENPDNYSDAYNFMLKEENKPLLDYYNMYMSYNESFSELTGKHIDKNFVAEISKDFMDRIGEVGLGALKEVKDSLMRSLEIREFDLVRGSIDPATGEPKFSIPLFYTDKLTKRLSPAEEKMIREDVALLYPENSFDFEQEYEKRIKAAEYVKGTKSKSRDLSRSLVLFAETAYNYKHLHDTEATATTLLHMLRAEGQKTEVTDAAGKRVINRFTQKAATMLGVPLSEIDAFRQFVDLYWYGRTTQSKDIKVFEKYSGTKLYQMIMRLTSATSLGLKPILAAGNLIGITSNMMMTASEGQYYNHKDVKESLKMLIKKDPKFAIAVAYIEPFAYDLTYRKANNLSVSKIVKSFTFENMFILHQLGDELIDKINCVSMMQRYGIDSNGKVKRIDKIEGDDKRSLLERLKIENDKFSIEGLNESQFIQFRSLVQRASTGIKGSMPDEDKNLIGTTLLGQALMHFRNWMPGLIEKRFKELHFDELLDAYDVGRFRVFFGEMTAKGAGPKVKAFTGMLREMIPFYHYYDKKGVNREITERYFRQYKLENPDSNLTIDEYIELRKAKLKGMAKELQIYFCFMLMVFLARAAVPDDEEEDTFAGRAAKLIAENAFRVTQRGLFEISFFFDPGTVTQLVKYPLPPIRTFENVAKLIDNTVDETMDVIYGEDRIEHGKEKAEHDKSPKLYYFSKIVPVSSSIVDFFDIFDTYNKDRGY